MTLRQEKLNTLFKKLTARFLQNESDKSLLTTVTDFKISSDLRRATAFISVFPENKEGKALDLLQKKRNELKEFFKQNTEMKIVPSVDFQIDKGEKNRQRLEKLLGK